MHLHIIATFTSMLQLYSLINRFMQLMQLFRNSGTTPRRFCNYSALFATFQ